MTEMDWQTPLAERLDRTKPICELWIAQMPPQNGEVEHYEFKPVGDSIMLAARMQDLLSLLREPMSGNPTGLVVHVDDFQCKGVCQKHLHLRFFPNKEWLVFCDGKDSAEMGDFWKLLEVLDRQHEFLMHATDACDHPFPVSCKERADGSLITTPLRKANE